MFKIEKNNRLKSFCLTLRLRRLENKRNDAISNLIKLYPEEASRMDNIENLPITGLVDLDIKIKATKKLLNKVSKN